MARKCVCVSCSEQFNSLHAYQWHRVAFRCLSAEAMRAKGMEQRENGVWVTRRNQFYRMTSEAKNGDLLKVIPG